MHKQKPQQHNRHSVARSIRRRTIRLYKSIRKAITPPKLKSQRSVVVYGRYHTRWQGLLPKSVVGIQKKAGAYMPHIGGGMYRKAHRKGILGALL